MTETSINRVQAGIMRRLFEQDGLRFASINTEKIPTDQFSYHLRQLIRLKLIEKLPDSTYRLTTKGRSKNIMLHPTENEFIEQGFIAVLVVAVKYENGQEHYLLQRRDKVPYKGTIAASGDKIYYGEKVEEAARRALRAQTGLTGEIELRSIWHMQDVYDGEIVQDKYFYAHLARQWTGNIQGKGPTGSNLWMPYDEIQESDQIVHNGADIIASLRTPALTFHEAQVTVHHY